MPVEEGQEPDAPTSVEDVLGSFGTFDLNERVAPAETPTLFREDGKPRPSFDQRYHEPFEGLVFLGALTNSFEWLGHTFVIRTLTSDELLAVAQIMKPWQGTVGEARAYATAMAAMIVVSIDGEGLPVPIGDDGRGDYAWARQRFNYAKSHWFPSTIDKIYSEFAALESTSMEVVAAMEKAYGPEVSTPGLSGDSEGPSDKVS